MLFGLFCIMCKRHLPYASLLYGSLSIYELFVAINMLCYSVFCYNFNKTCFPYSVAFMIFAKILNLVRYYFLSVHLQVCRRYLNLVLDFRSQQFPLTILVWMFLIFTCMLRSLMPSRRHSLRKLTRFLDLDYPIVQKVPQTVEAIG